MNKEQFKIVKSMQAIGVKSKDFAKSCNVKEAVMTNAYLSNNYEDFRSSEENPLDFFSKGFGI